ncbi:MAG: Crp/Fnr family transcriptional regulator [Synechococcaceae cyanobacterium SM2_3_60]|nr:Crp/Fnr family transcriptional regulator [Synechococcaceae cyanobacterium SM2_3_60]
MLGTQVRSREWLEQLYQDYALTPYPMGASITLTDSELLIVYRGVVQLFTIHPNGDETLLGLAGPSTPIGLPISVIDPYQAVALTQVDVLRLPWAEVETSPELSSRLLPHLVLRLRQTEAWLALSGRRPVSERLKQLLLLLKQDFGQRTPQGTRLTVRLTHQHLANAIGATRVTVTRLLSEFRSEGWLRLDGSRHLVICD